MSDPLTALRNWTARAFIDETADETIDDNISVSTEMVFIKGESVVLRRVFARAKGYAAYSRVGWVVKSDCTKCMVCSVQLLHDEDKLHCFACGNIVCPRCGSEKGKVSELSNAWEEVPVCSLCFWGQELVSAVLRPAAPSQLFSPAQRSVTLPSSPLRSSSVTTSSSIRQTDTEDSFTKLSAVDTSDDDSEEGQPRRVLGLSKSKLRRTKTPEPAVSVQRKGHADLLRNGDSDVAVCALRGLASNLAHICIQSEDAEASGTAVEDALMAHILDSIGSLATLESFGKSEHRNELFKSAMNYLFDSAVGAATGATYHESYPVMWIREQFSGRKRNLEDSNTWLPLHWCAMLSSKDAKIDAAYLRCLLEENRLSQTLEKGDNEVSVLSLAVAKSNPSLSFVDALLSSKRNAAATRDEDGAYPLMYAAAWNTGTTVLSRLYDMYPSAVSQTDAFGFTPLLFACYAGNLAAVKFLFQKYPKAVKMRNHAGALPLHACAANTKHGSVEMARVLLENNADAVSQGDNEGSLPLHVAAQFADIALIRYLYDAYPAGATILNSEGLLPMHLAGLRKQKSVEVLNLLTEFAQSS